MSVSPCSFEILPPAGDVSPAHVHPDPDVYARMAAVARGHVARRFALCRYNADGPAGSSNVLCEYFGLQYRDGVTITDHRGRPVGWYTTLDSAHHHLTDKRPFPLWLVWLEPATPFTTTEQSTAATEAAQLEPGPFIVGVAFLAAGPTDAQLHAIRLIEAAESFLPEVQRHASMIASYQHGNHSLFCPQPGCVKTWKHPGDHDIPPYQEPGHQPPKADLDGLDLSEAHRDAIDQARQRDPADEHSDTDSRDTDES